MSTTVTLFQLASILGISIAEALRLVRAGALKPATNQGRYRKTFAADVVLAYVKGQQS